jgi:hypothetical protein
MSPVLAPLLRYEPRRSYDWTRVGERYTDVTAHPVTGPASRRPARFPIRNPGVQSGAQSQWNFGI